LIKNLKYFLVHYYADFYQKEYLAVLNSFRIVISVLVPLGLFVYTQNQNFIWLGLCCLLWSLHIFMQNKTAFIFKSMYLSLIICTVLQILGFVAHLSIYSYIVFSFFIAFLIPYAAYFKQVVLYDLAVYFIVQNSVFFERDIYDMSESIFASILAFFIVVFVGRFIIRVNIKKLILYRSKVNLNNLLSYLEKMQRFILIGTKKNYESLGKKREDLFRSLKVFREFYPVYTVNNQDAILAKISPVQERFIETTIGFCLQIRHIHTAHEDAQKIKEIFSKLIHVTRQQRKLIFEIDKLPVHEVLVRYKRIFSFAKDLTPMPSLNTQLEAKELEEINSAIFQFKESIALMEIDIQKSLFTT